jgi:hypothetical protein
MGEPAERWQTPGEVCSSLWCSLCHPAGSVLRALWAALMIRLNFTWMIPTCRCGLNWLDIESGTRRLLAFTTGIRLISTQIKLFTKNETVG